MKIAVFSPFGGVRQESGLQFLTARHLASRGLEIMQVRCNGALSACDRDLTEPQGREFRSCVRCMGESKRLADWAGIPVVELSRFLSAEDVSETREMVLTHSPVELLAAQFEGAQIGALCGDDLARRLGVGPGELHHKRHEETVRHVVLSVLRTVAAMRSFSRVHQPDVLFLGRTEDMLSRAAAAAFTGTPTRAAVFSWNAEKHLIMIEDRCTGAVMESALVFDDLPSMRGDVATWPAEIVRQLDTVEAFLELTEAQLTLPLARANS